jgi:hypothetical protein
MRATYPRTFALRSAISSLPPLIASVRSVEATLIAALTIDAQQRTSGELMADHSLRLINASLISDERTNASKGSDVILKTMGSSGLYIGVLRSLT